MLAGSTTRWTPSSSFPTSSFSGCSPNATNKPRFIEKGYQRIFSGRWARYAWGNFVTLTGNELFDTLRGAIEKLHELPGLSPTGQLLFRNATLKIHDRPTLRAVVQIIAGMDLSPHDSHDVKGDMYEYLLSKLSQSGTNGQFRTPRHIIDLIVALVDPKSGMRICDPACGTAGFLIAIRRLPEKCRMRASSLTSTTN